MTYVLCLKRHVGDEELYITLEISLLALRITILEENTRQTQNRI